jgi:hypothetical protein
LYQNSSRTYRIMFDSDNESTVIDGSISDASYISDASNLGPVLHQFTEYETGGSKLCSLTVEDNLKFKGKATYTFELSVTFEEYSPTIEFLGNQTRIVQIRDTNWNDGDLESQFDYSWSASTGVTLDKGHAEAANFEFTNHVVEDSVAGTVYVTVTQTNSLGFERILPQYSISIPFDVSFIDYSPIIRFIPYRTRIVEIRDPLVSPSMFNYQWSASPGVILWRDNADLGLEIYEKFVQSQVEGTVYVNVTQINSDGFKRYFNKSIVIDLSAFDIGHIVVNECSITNFRPWLTVDEECSFTININDPIYNGTATYKVSLSAYGSSGYKIPATIQPVGLNRTYTFTGLTFHNSIQYKLYVLKQDIYGLSNFWKDTGIIVSPSE